MTNKTCWAGLFSREKGYIGYRAQCCVQRC